MRFVTKIDHVQFAIPPGTEVQAGEFWVGLMGFEYLATPAILGSRANRWFQSGDVQVHVGVEQDFHPARKAHPALVVTRLDDLVQRLEDAGHEVRWAEDIPGVKRCHTFDPFGNRIELIEA